jgi:YD repeat-containing protein
MRRLPFIVSLVVLAMMIHVRGATADSVSYGYDATGRVTTVTYIVGTGTTIITYTYDAAGNRTKKAITCTGATC